MLVLPLCVNCDKGTRGPGLKGLAPVAGSLALEGLRAGVAAEVSSVTLEAS